jgi:protein TonB
MSWVRSIALFLSAALHAALLLFFASRPDVLGLEEGKGRDDVTVAIPISIENSDLLGLNERNAEASEAAAPARSPGRERQEPEAQNPDPVTERTVQTATEETSPPVPEAKPADQAKSPAEDVSPEQAGRALEARRMQLSSSYMRDIFKSLSRHSVNPDSSRTGRVVILATIASSGKLVGRKIAESSGSDILDNAALATVDKSSPFPAMPRELGSDQMTLRLPFEYETR